MVDGRGSTAKSDDETAWRGSHVSGASPGGEGLAIAHGANVPIDEEAASYDLVKREP